MLPEKLKYRDYEKALTVQPGLGNQRVSLRSDEVHTKLHRSITSCNEATQPRLPDNIIRVIYASVFGRFMHSLMRKISSSILSLK